MQSIQRSMMQVILKYLMIIDQSTYLLVNCRYVMVKAKEYFRWMMISFHMTFNC